MVNCPVCGGVPTLVGLDVHKTKQSMQMRHINGILCERRRLHVTVSFDGGCTVVVCLNSNLTDI